MVTRYELEQLRCNGCGACRWRRCRLRPGARPIDVALKVNLALAHYHLGLPFKRIESYQDLVGMPLPDATQWELVEQVADSVYPVYEYLKTPRCQPAPGLSRRHRRTLVIADQGKPGRPATPA